MCAGQNVQMKKRKELHLHFPAISVQIGVKSRWQEPWLDLLILQHTHLHSFVSFYPFVKR